MADNEYKDIVTTLKANNIRMNIYYVKKPNMYVIQYKELLDRKERKIHENKFKMSASGFFLLKNLVELMFAHRIPEHWQIILNQIGNMEIKSSDQRVIAYAQAVNKRSEIDNMVEDVYGNKGKRNKSS
jgi:hypothetical protein